VEVRSRRGVGRQIVDLPADAFPQFFDRAKGVLPGGPEETLPHPRGHTRQGPRGIDPLDCPLQVSRVDVGGPEPKIWSGGFSFSLEGPQDRKAVRLLPQGAARRPDPQSVGELLEKRREDLRFQRLPHFRIAEEAADRDVQEAPGLRLGIPVGIEPPQVGPHRGAAELLHVPDDALLRAPAHPPVPLGTEGKAVQKQGKIPRVHDARPQRSLSCNKRAISSQSRSRFFTVTS